MSEGHPPLPQRYLRLVEEKEEAKKCIHYVELLPNGPPEDCIGFAQVVIYKDLHVSCASCCCFSRVKVWVPNESRTRWFREVCNCPQAAFGQKPLVPSEQYHYRPSHPTDGNHTVHLGQRPGPLPATGCLSFLLGACHRRFGIVSETVASPW